MNKWVYVELSEVVIVQSGGTPSKANAAFWDGDIPWISARDMHEMRLRDTHLKLTAEGAERARVMPEGTVFVLTRGMTLLRDLPVVVSSFAAACNQDVKSLRVGPDLSPTFLAYLLTARKDELLQAVTLAGHGTGRLDSAALASFPVPVPPLGEQQRITDILGTWDDRIDKLTNRRTLASKIYAATLDSLFGQETAARSLGSLTVPIVSRNSAGALGRERVMGVSNSTGITAMRPESIASDIARYLVLPPRGFAYNPMRINVGSIAMSRLDCDVLVSPDYVAFTCREDLLMPEYLAHALKTERWSYAVNSRGSGSVRSRTYYDDLATISLPVPDLQKQERIVLALDSMSHELTLLDREIALLKQQKRGLMQKLLTGDIRVTVDSTLEVAP